MPKMPLAAGGAALFLFAALPSCFPQGEGAGGSYLSGVSQGGVYTRSSPQALVISEGGTLIIEETDGSSRPALRTEWKDGEEYAVTRWEYEGEGMYPCTRITSTAEGTARVAFDANGMEAERAFFSSDGALLSRSKMEYAESSGEDGGHDLVSLTEEAFSPSGEVLSSDGSVYTYNEDGSVKSLAVYEDGAIVKLIQYGEGNSRTETVFYEGEAIFTAEYRDGVRVRAGRRGQDATEAEGAEDDATEAR